jgi:hypothetical protein
MANLDGLDDKEYSFNNKPDVYDMAEAFITESEEQETDFSIHLPLIKKYPDTDKQLKLLVQKNGKDFATKTLEDVELITFRGKIYMPKELQSRVVAWYLLSQERDHIPIQEYIRIVLSKSNEML